MPSNAMQNPRARIADQRSLAAAVVLATLLLGTAACATHAPHSAGYTLRAAPGSLYQVEEGRATIHTEDYQIVVAPLTDLERAAFIDAKAPGSPDPFGPDQHDKPRYITFKMTVQSLSKRGPVALQPQNLLLASDTNDRILPLDYPQAYMRLAGEALNDPRLIDDLSKYLFDIGISVPAGGMEEKLLVYQAPKSMAHRLRLEMSFIEVAGQAASNYDVFFDKVSAP